MPGRGPISSAPSASLSTTWPACPACLWRLWPGLFLLHRRASARRGVLHGQAEPDLLRRPGGSLWASLTLALLTLPVVIVATEEAVAAVPRSMREGSYACGASKWQTIWRIVLPRAMPGILTGMILAMARGAGEVAPLMLSERSSWLPPCPSTASFPSCTRTELHAPGLSHLRRRLSRARTANRPSPWCSRPPLADCSDLPLNLAAMWLRPRLRKRHQVSQ